MFHEMYQHNREQDLLQYANLGQVYTIICNLIKGDTFCSCLLFAFV